MENKNKNLLGNHLHLEIKKTKNRTSIGLTDEKQKIMNKKLLDFISMKNKIIFKSCFDHKGAKQFLKAKDKALEEFTLIDEIEIIDDQKKKILSSKKIHQKIHHNYFAKNGKKKNHKKKNNKYNSNITNVRIDHPLVNRFSSSNCLSKHTFKHSKVDNCIIINHLKYENRSKSDSSISNINKIESGYLVTKEDNILVSSIINEMNSCYKD
jgi:hypothetical protein